jgi:hypothetical protein
MNTDNLQDLPAWETVYPPFVEADKKNEDRPIDDSCEAAQLLYEQWGEILCMIRGALDIQDGDFKMAEFQEEIDEIVGMDLSETERVRRVYWIRIKVQIILNSYEVGKLILEAESRKLYNSKMENAVFIRKIVITVETLIGALMAANEDLIEESYALLIRDEIENFRVLFVKWISTFEKDYNDLDEWGIFN